MGKEVIKIEDIKKGLESKPPYTDFMLEWITDEGYKLFENRVKSMDHWHKVDERNALNAIETISNDIGNNVVVVDIASGKIPKSVNLLSALVKNHPARQIYFIPIDVSDVILDWPTYIKDFDIAKNVVGVKPLVCDAVGCIGDLSNIIDQIEPQKKWEVIFWGVGPIAAHFPQQQLAIMINKICRFIKTRGSGFLVLTFIELSPDTQTQWDKCLDMCDVSKQLESVLLGLKVIGESDLDTSNFKYIHEYAENFSTPGCQGHWSGCTYYAQAKKDITITFKHCNLLNTTLELKEGDKFRLSLGTTSSQFYEAQYLSSFANVNDLAVGGIGPADKEFGMASIIYKCKD